MLLLERCYYCISVWEYICNKCKFHQVTWKPPPREDWNGEILGYYVGYRQSSDKPYMFETVDFSKEDIKEHHLQIANLKTYTQYGVVVQAFNKVGSGPMSEERRQHTAEGVPEQPPHDTTCTTLTSQTIRVSWVSPPLSAANGVITGYKVSKNMTREGGIKSFAVASLNICFRSSMDRPIRGTTRIRKTLRLHLLAKPSCTVSRNIPTTACKFWLSHLEETALSLHQFTAKLSKMVIKKLINILIHCVKAHIFERTTCSVSTFSTRSSYCYQSFSHVFGIHSYLMASTQPT